MLVWGEEGLVSASTKIRVQQCLAVRSVSPELVCEEFAENIYSL